MINDFQNLCIINQIEQHGVLYKSAIFMKSTWFFLSCINHSCRMYTVALQEILVDGPLSYSSSHIHHFYCAQKIAKDLRLINLIQKLIMWKFQCRCIDLNYIENLHLISLFKISYAKYYNYSTFKESISDTISNDEHFDILTM